MKLSLHEVRKKETYQITLVDYGFRPYRRRSMLVYARLLALRYMIVELRLLSVLVRWEI